MSDQFFVQKPALTPLFFCAAALWASCAAGLVVLEAITGAGLHAFGFAGLAVAIVCAVLLVRRGLSSVVLLVLGAGLGMMCACVGALHMHLAQDIAHRNGLTQYRFQIVEDVHESEYGRYSIAIASDEAGNSFRVRVNLPADSDALCWDVFYKQCSIRAPSQAAQSYYWRKGCVGSITPYDLDLRKPKGPLGLIAHIREAGLSEYQSSSGEGVLLLRSIAFGDRGSLFASPFYGTVKRCGLAHIVAVSGAHLSIAVAALALLLQILRFPKRLSICFQAVFVVAYVLFTGAPHSAVRACAMVLCLLFAFFGKRRNMALNSLSVCIIVFLALQPQLALSTSLALSAAATLGIVLFSGYFSWWIYTFLNCARPLCEILGMTFAALFCTLPITVSLFGQLSFIAPLSNVLVAPVFAILCVGGMLAAVLSALFHAPLFCVLAVGFAQLFCDTLTLLANVPYAATVVSAPWWLIAFTTLSAGVAIIKLWPRPSWKAAASLVSSLLAFALALIVCAPTSHGTEIVMLDVGQGDAFVLRSGKDALLIDTGNQDSAVLQALARSGVHHLDAVLISHPDSDHCAALPSIIQFVEVDRVLVAKDLLDCSCFNCRSLRLSAGDIPLVGLECGSAFSWGAFSARVLAPESFVDEGGNDDSLVVRIEIDANSDGVGDASALFCGDAETEVLDTLASKGELDSVDILKVGHHGSKHALSPELLEVLTPRIALISAGQNNRYGHPNPDTLALLEEAEVEILRTDTSGDVVCIIEASSLKVSTLR
ncbi:MAG: DNA internalization-related competence protein ComEC/Rec2 [Eggerthellaceae bacterium]|nr:DNA internalization-related competence protein ComEC/Rec2 [Eggerthellaceae bacterium]